MRRLTAILAAAILAITLSGCAPDEPTPTEKRFGLDGTDIAARAFLDGDTGVYYLVLKSSGGGLAVTPIINPDGTPARVDDADYSDVKPDIDANTKDWIRELLEFEREH